jgi:uncharacterized protein YjbJ (UPF0337 family)
MSFLTRAKSRAKAATVELKDAVGQVINDAGLQVEGKADTVKGGISELDAKIKEKLTP